MNLQRKEIQNLFDTGSLKKCEIIENKPLWEEGFVIWFTTKSGTQVTLRTQRSAERIKTFKSIQSALNIAKSIGFKSIEIKYIEQS